MFNSWWEAHMKKYVEVVSRTDTGGNTRPMTVIWEDGRRYEIQSVLGAAQAANPIGGGMGMRFTCFINGVTTYFENPKWFVDAKEDW